MGEQLHFSMDGEFLTAIARDWFWNMDKPYKKCEELLLSCMMGGNEEEKRHVCQDIIEGRKRLVGVNEFELVDDNVHVRSLGQKVEELQHRMLVNQIREDMIAHPLNYVDRFAMTDSYETLCTNAKHHYIDCSYDGIKCFLYGKTGYSDAFNNGAWLFTHPDLVAEFNGEPLPEQESNPEFYKTDFWTKLASWIEANMKGTSVERRQRRAKANGTISKKCVKQDTAQSKNPSKRAKEIGIIKRRLPGYKKDVLCIGIKNKEAKYTNRTRPEGWLTPTANQLLQTHINLVRKMQKFLPISDVVLEVNKFAFMRLDNPDIQKWQYQQGPLYQKGSLENAVSEMQEHHCLFCDKPIDHYHHVVPQSENGSNTIANIVGLCAEHHNLVHKDAAWQKKLAEEKVGLNKKYGALSVLNQIIPALTNKLSVLFPKHFFVTAGKSTHDYRAAHGVSKDHWLDAYCIACSVLPSNVCDSNINNHMPYELKQFRRHDRRVLNNENMNRVYTLDNKAVAINRHKATEQEAASLEEFRKEHPNDVCKLKVKEHHPTYRNMNRNYPGSIFLVGKHVHIMQGIAGSKDGKATTYKDSNANSITASKCKFVAKNSGILFV